MTDREELDLDLLRCWIGRCEQAWETVTPELVHRFRSTLDLPEGRLANGAPAPPLIHFCLALPTRKTRELESDGHAGKGDFLPPVPLQSRMWAGGEVRWVRPLLIGDRIHRHSRIEDIQAKRGRSGLLCFVTVIHELFGAGGLVIQERQDIVYRDPAPPDPGLRSEPASTPRKGCRKTVRATPILLFRYSALTFNSHRIHYDRPYATGQEGYPGLVVQGPLQATMLASCAADLKGTGMSRFAFRSHAPAFDGDDLRIYASSREDGLALWIENQHGTHSITATAV